MSRVILLSPKQSRQAKALVRKLCCNYDGGHCILLDDGDPCVCPQLITYSHIICKWFKVAVLPVDEELYIQVMQPPNSKRCSVCGRYYQYKGNKSKYCPDCKPIVTRRQAAERKQKQRLLSRNKGI